MYQMRQYVSFILTYSSNKLKIYFLKGLIRNIISSTHYSVRDPSYTSWEQTLRHNAFQAMLEIGPIQGPIPLVTSCGKISEQNAVPSARRYLIMALLMLALQPCI